MSKATFPTLDLGGAPLTVSEEGKKEKRRLPLLDRALHEQQDLTAVERFSRLHEAGEIDEEAQRYSSLIPLERPRTGEQFAFEVDLDRCTGCKACVTACHSMNGLDDGETWRFVGLLHGGSAEQPVQKTVTSSCHHCLDPACLNGCPVGAYEKDPDTGIVKHLDDQCIGCQYCMFTCPYEVPQFNADKGIVRKCDMCSDRLADGEAPACVQACPNEAIGIRVVGTHQVIEDAQSEAFLPGAPSPAITLPTTSYKTSQALPRNLLPADFFHVRKAHRHLPLVLMLVLTQLSVGAFCVDQVLPAWVPTHVLQAFRPFHGATALALGLLALGASVAHLGRPQYAWKAFIGLRTSWLSREILAFAIYAKLAILYALALVQAQHPPLLEALPRLRAWSEAAVGPLGLAVCTAGLAGVACSVMVYGVTQRLWWSISRTGFKFVGTALVLGLSTASITAFAGLSLGTVPLHPEVAHVARLGAVALAVATVIKLLGEASVLWHLRDKRYGDLKRSAMLIIGELRRVAIARATCAIAGGVVVPLLAFAQPDRTSIAVGLFASTASLLLLLIGELLERGIFFAAVVSPRMPGGLR